MSLDKRTIVIGVSGGISAYKICTLVSALKKQGADVHVVMTHNAKEFVTPLTFETLSGNRVISDMFDLNFEYDVKHISLSKKADVLLIAPATANIIAKISVGIADDFLSTLALSVTCPVYIAPAMNTAMLNNPVTKSNIKALQARGFNIINSASGHLACNDTGAGRLPEPEDIFKILENHFNAVKDFENRTLIITAGGTRQMIDPVRFITNKSSGKMGLELARAAYKRGAKIIFVKSAFSNLDTNSKWETINVETTKDMYDAVMSNLPKATDIILAGAPCDYDINTAQQKIKDSKLTLNLTKTVDIAKETGAIKANRRLVIFAAETENLIQNAKAKMKNKNADMVVANDVSLEDSGFDSDNNTAVIITKDSEKPLIKMPKSELAHKILDNLARL